MYMLPVLVNTGQQVTKTFCHPLARDRTRYTGILSFALEVTQINLGGEHSMCISRGEVRVSEVHLQEITGKSGSTSSALWGQPW